MPGTQDGQFLLPPNHHQLIYGIALSLFLGLSGCDGGGGHSSSSTSTESIPATPTPTYKLGGTLSGLESAGLILSHGSNTISPAAGDTSFSFANGLAAGTNYSITVQTQPPLARCVVSNGDGTMPAHDNTEIAVTCSSNFVLTVIHAFQGTITDGLKPYGSLIEGKDGNFYGMTFLGGSSFQGNIFTIKMDGQLSVLHTFSGSDGEAPYGDLIQSNDDSFYGMTRQGGANGYGTIFKITSNGTYTLIHSFSGVEGAYPTYNNLLQANDNNFYGLTSSGGAYNVGAAFKMTSNGTVTQHYSFSGSTAQYPEGSLIQASDSNFYGLTTEGGAYNCGTVFKLTLSGVHTVLHDFTCTDDGLWPRSGLIEATDGNFYGVTSNGGASGHGVVFKITPAGNLSVIHNFVGGNSGSRPYGSLIQATDGNFYGMTIYGALNNQGTVFRIKPNGTYTEIHQFDGAIDGGQPSGRLIQASDGNLYGMTYVGGAYNGGTIFKLATQ